jgi:transposase InsO family protein
VEALPCRATDAKHAWRMFYEVIFPRFGTPKMVICDRGSHFIDKTFWNFLKELGSRHNIATPYHPQTSGQAETSNKQIKNILQKKGQWDGERLEGQATWCTLSIHDSLQNPHRHVTIPARLWKKLPFTSRVRA